MAGGAMGFADSPGGAYLALKWVASNGNVLGPFAEGGQIDLHHVQAIKQVFAEMLLFHHVPERSVGGSDDAARRPWMVSVPPTRSNEPFLEHARATWPAWSSARRHLVEKEGAAVGPSRSGRGDGSPRPVKALSRGRTIRFPAASRAGRRS